MPVPQTWDDINSNPALNSPSGSEPIGTLADDYIRQAFAYSKQLHDGWLDSAGVNPFTASLNAGGFTITNLAAPVNPGDAAPKSYADGLISTNFPHGTILLFYGASTAVPVGWQICDGTNGTPDMRNRFAIGAGDQTAWGVVGGNSFPVISSSQMPVHNHGVSDPGHAHGVNDPGHAHGVADNGHSHGQPNLGSAQAGSDNGGVGVAVSDGYGTSRGQGNVSASGTGIGIYGNTTGIGIYGSGTGIAINNAGGSSAFDNRPSFVGLYYIMKS